MHDFTILILRGANASSVATTLDVLSAAAAMAPRVGASMPRWRVVCAGDAEVALSNAMSVTGKPLPRYPRADRSIWIVPGLGIANPKGLTARFGEEDALQAIAALRTHARAGGQWRHLVRRFFSCRQQVC